MNRVGHPDQTTVPLPVAEFAPAEVASPKLVSNVAMTASWTREAHRTFSRMTPRARSLIASHPGPAKSARGFVNPTAATGRNPFHRCPDRSSRRANGQLYKTVSQVPLDDGYIVFVGKLEGVSPTWKPSTI
jgi:hypothetical protein